MLCSQLNVLVSRYLVRRHKPASPRKQEDLLDYFPIQAVHARRQGIYRANNIQAELVVQGI